MKNNNSSSKIEQLINLGSDIAGATIGGALGFIAGDPVLAAGAAGLGVTISQGAKKLLGDITTRDLSKREQSRIGAAAAIALYQIRRRLEAGEHPRDDGFFDNSGLRSEAEELFEGVLIKSKNEYQEKKVRILGNIFANVVFYSGLSAGEASYILNVTERLTYRQICFMALLLQKPQIEATNLIKESDRNSGKISALKTISALKIISLLQEIFDLYTYGLVARKNPTNEFHSAMLGWFDVTPDYMILTDLGRQFSELMGLQTIPVDDLRYIIRQLSV